MRERIILSVIHWYPTDLKIWISRSESVTNAPEPELCKKGIQIARKFKDARK
jgi:hypothetical protein